MARRDGHIVILTGAGISRESGLHTFRDADGIWTRVRIEDVATPQAFRRDPEMVHGFYNMRRRALQGADIQPNAAHAALGRLKREWPGTVTLITQNIDDLHERGGYPDPIHMHGEMLKIRCEACEMVMEWREDLSTDLACVGCGATGGLRPHVVWFGEIPLEMDRIVRALSDCSMFISIGTSGNVYPAAGFVSMVRGRPGVRTVELNLEPSEGASLFEEAEYGPATEVVPRFVDALLREGL